MPSSLTGSFGYSSLLSGNYVFYQRLQTDAQKIAKENPMKAEQLQSLYNNAKKKGDLYLSDGTDKIAETASFLRQQAQAERIRELRMLEKEFGIQLSPEILGKDFYKELIRAYTTFNQGEEGFKRIIAKMSFGKKNNKNVGIIADANFIVDKFVKIVDERIDDDFCAMVYKQAESIGGIENLEKNVQIVLQKEMNKIIVQAAIQAFDSKIISEKIWTDSTGLGEEARAMNQKGYKDQELLNELKNIQMNGSNSIIVEGFRQIYGIDQIVAELTQAISSGTKIRKGTAKKKIQSLGDNCKVSAQKGGLMQEYVVNETMRIFARNVNSTNGSGVNLTAVHAGGQGFKADNIYMIDLPTQQLKSIIETLNSGKQVDSVYEDNVRKMQEIYDKIKHLNKESFLVFENVKTAATGTSNFKGFKAGDPMSLETFSNLMTKAGNLSNANSFIGLILQLAPGAVYGNSPEMRENLRINISKALANFLFEDYQMIGAEYHKKGSNAVHLFNLNGIRVPLSFFLEAAADAIMKSGKSVNGIFNVTFKIPQILYGESVIKDPRDFTPGMWENQRNSALKNSKITVHFLKNFEKIMLEFFGGII